jgi:hypothetical protein
MAPSAIEVEEINELAHTINDPPVEHDLSRGSKRKLIIDADDGIRNHRY